MKRFLSVLLWVLGIAATIHFSNRYTNLEQDMLAIAESTVSFITKEEGFRNTAYRDAKGKPTIGVGHLIKADEKNLLTAVLSDEQVMTLLRSDLKWCKEAVETSIRVPLNQNQTDALHSLCFNIGETNFKNSTVVDRLNKNDYHGAADAILLWNKPSVLEKRRRRERALFLRSV
jgi:lysozyme